MKEKYTPELGQMVFGQPWQEQGCPDHLETALNAIRHFMDVNKTTGSGSDFNTTPFDNSGDKYKNDEFEVNAYDWTDCNCGAWWEDRPQECTCGWEPQEYNFKWRDIEVSWYKYLGRGMSVNRKVSPQESSELINECMKSLICH